MKFFKSYIIIIIFFFWNKTLKSDKHEERHKPGINQGIVIKINSNQKYATNAVTSFIFKEAARRAQVPVQVSYFRSSKFEIQNCWSTTINK